MKISDDNLVAEEDDDSGGSSVANHGIIYIELYLVILSFFIILNSIAKIDNEKKNFSIQSVRESFSNFNKDIDFHALSYKLHTGLSQLQNTFYVQHHSLIKLKEINFVTKENIAYALYDSQDFFDINSAELSVSGKALLDDIAYSITGVTEPPAKYGCKILIGHDNTQYFDVNNINKFDLVRKRLTSLAIELENLGIKKKNIAIGIRENEHKGVKFIFEFSKS